jgi:hypothetical protein
MTAARTFRPAHDTPTRVEYHHRLSVAYHAEQAFVLASLVVAAAEQCDDLEAGGALADVDFTFFSLSYRSDEVAA